MARPLQIEFHGAGYQVMHRGNQRQAVFREDRDDELFLETLSFFTESFDVKVRRYCLRPNLRKRADRIIAKLQEGK